MDCATHCPSPSRITAPGLRSSLVPPAAPCSSRRPSLSYGTGIGMRGGLSHGVRDGWPSNRSEQLRPT